MKNKIELSKHFAKFNLIHFKTLIIFDLYLIF